MKVELLKKHTHAGKEFKIGDFISLNELSAKWLIDIKVAKLAPGEPVKQSLTKGK